MKRILIIGGVVLVLGVVIVTCLFACNRDKTKDEPTTSNTPPSTTTTTITTSVTATSKTSPTPTTAPTTSTTPTTTQTTVTTTTPTTTPTTITTSATTKPPTTKPPTTTPATAPPPKATEPPVTQPPQTQPPATEPQGYTFTREDMEELLAYGESLEFGFARLFDSPDSIEVYFGNDESSKLLALELAKTENTFIRIGTREGASSTLVTYKDYATSLSYAKERIYSFYNGQ